MASTHDAGRDRGHHVSDDRQWAVCLESCLPLEKLGQPEDLAQVDGLPDDAVFFRAVFHPVLGRSSTPVVCCQQLMFFRVPPTAGP